MGPIATRQAPNDEDRKLLEELKEAIQLKCKWSAKGGFERYDNNGAEWNPLARDVDAMELAYAIPGIDVGTLFSRAWEQHLDEHGRGAFVRRGIVEAVVQMHRRRKADGMS